MCKVYKYLENIRIESVIDVFIAVCFDYDSCILNELCRILRQRIVPKKCLCPNDNELSISKIYISYL